MENKNQLIRDILIKQVNEKYFTSLDSENSIWRNKQFTKLSKIISNFDFKPFSKTTKINLSSRTIVKFYKGDNVAEDTLSILVICAYSDDIDFINYLKLNYNSSLNFAWEAFQEYLSNSNPVSENHNLNKKNHSESKLLQFRDPLLFIYKQLKNNYIYVFIFYVILYQVSVIFLAITTNVWDGIDFPLNKSISVYFGYLFFAISATQFTSVSYTHLTLPTKRIV